MTQAQLGSALPNPVHAKTVGRWERGAAHPRGQLSALERALGVRLTNSPDYATTPGAADVESMSDDELVAAMFRIGAELARRLPGARTEQRPLTSEEVIARGMTATTRSSDGATSAVPSAAHHG